MYVWVPLSFVDKFKKKKGEKTNKNLRKFEVEMFEVWYTCEHEQICCTTNEKVVPFL
jgi:hypothetical protein